MMLLRIHHCYSRPAMVGTVQEKVALTGRDSIELGMPDGYGQ